jgi:hypothetical protein
VSKEADKGESGDIQTEKLLSKGPVTGQSLSLAQLSTQCAVVALVGYRYA